MNILGTALTVAAQPLIGAALKEAGAHGLLGAKASTEAYFRDREDDGQTNGSDMIFKSDSVINQRKNTNQQFKELDKQLRELIKSA